MNIQPPGDGSREEQQRRAHEIDRRNSQKAGSFALSNLFIVIAAAIGSTFVNQFSSVLNTIASHLLKFENQIYQIELPDLHWLVFVVALNIIYVLASYSVEVFSSRGGLLALVFRIPSWVELRNFGDQRVARISYVALAAIPVTAYFIVENPLQLELLSGAKLPLNTKISFFIAFFLSLALLTFAVGCPKEFHRKPAFGGAKTVNVVLTSVERSVVNVLEEQDFFDEALDSSKVELRTVCWLFYTVGLVLSFILLIRAAAFVLNA